MSGPERSIHFATPLLVPMICAASILAGSPGVSAQRAPMAGQQPHHVVFSAQSAHRMPVNRESSVAHPARLPFREHRGTNANLGCIGGGAGLSVQQLLEPFPGYGLDFEHLNALNSDLGIKAAIDPATALRLAEAELLACRTIGNTRYFLVGGAGYVVPEGVDQQSEDAPQPAAQPQIILLQQAPAAQLFPQPAPTAQEEAAPLPDEGQFVLVLRDGTQVQAVAFTRTADKIIYITTEGTRRTMAVSDLDSAATIRANEERGTPLQLSR
jgi:hypothetical protein